MIQATAPSPIQVRDKLKEAFINHIGGDVNQSNLNSLVDFVGNVIRLGHVNCENGDKIACAPDTVLAAAKNAFVALKEIHKNDKAKSDLIASAETKLSKAFAQTHGARILQDSLKSSEPMLNEIVAQLEKAVAKGKESDPNLLQRLVAQAEVSAGDDVKLFGEHLGVLLKEESANLSVKDITNTKNSIAILRSQVSAYAAFEISPELINVNKFLDIKDGTKTEGMSVDDKKQVTDLIKEAEEAIAAAPSGREKQHIANAMNKLTRDLGQLSHEHRLYFKELTGKYAELKKSEPHEWIGMIKNSLPGLVVPGIIGAMIAYVFGMSAELGMIGAAALSLLGGASDKAKPPAKIPTG